MKTGEIWKLKPEKKHYRTVNGEKVRIRFVTNDSKNDKMVAYTFIDTGLDNGLSREEFINYFKREYNS